MHAEHIHEILPLLGTMLLFNPLPDDKILDWSKLKQITDDILSKISAI